MTSVQTDFSGGINAFRDETKLADNECIFARNVRSRSGALEGIYEAVEYPITVDTTDAGDISDLGVNFTDYTVRILRMLSFKGDIYAVVSFVDVATSAEGIVGLFKLDAGTGSWALLQTITDWAHAYLASSDTAGSGYTIDDLQQECFALEIPGSSEFVKKTAAGANPYADVTYGAIETGDKTEAGLLIVVNQYEYIGMVLVRTSNAFLLVDDANILWINHAIADWAVDSRVYVPYKECRGLTYSDGILYWVADNGTDIYRSVQGRPLDFVINIKADGTPGETSLDLEEKSTAYSVSANPITCIRALTTGQIFVATRYESYFLEPNYNELIFGEVTFNKSPAFQTGAVNQDSIVELPNDLAVIVPDGGIRSFNAVMQNKWRGRNSVFSLKIDNLIGDLTQTGLAGGDLPDSWYLHPCCEMFDNYAMFSVKTDNGMVVMVYDTLTETWTSVDSYFTSTTTQIRNFAIRDLTTSFELWAQVGTTVYQLFGATTKYDCELRPRALSTQIPSKKGKHTNAFAVFQGGEDETEVRWVEYVDDKRGRTVKQQLQITNSGIVFPVDYPVMFTEQRKINDIKFNVEGLGNRGWKFQSRIYWPGKAKLLYYQVDVQEMPGDVGVLQSNAAYRNDQ